MDYIVRGVTKSQTRLTDFYYTGITMPEALLLSF